MPVTAAHARQHRGFQQELNQDVGLPGPDGLADADLVGALGHRHQKSATICSAVESAKLSGLL